jgi:uncharacterized DUF497 family protein
MELTIVCKPSAFKHGVSESDIRWAFNTARYDRFMEGGDNRYLLIGFDTRGNLLEVMYNDLGSQRVNVFHAMKCRNALFALLDR